MGVSPAGAVCGVHATMPWAVIILDGKPPLPAHRCFLLGVKQRHWRKAVCVASLVRVGDFACNRNAQFHVPNATDGPIIILSRSEVKAH